MTVLATLLVAIGLAAAQTGSPEPQTTLPDVEDEVMCVECGTALNVSQAPVADQERDFIRARIAEGMTKEEIKEALVREYGNDVLAEPPGGGFNVTAWLVPAALAAAGALAVVLLTRRWRRRPARDAAAAATPLDPDDARRLDAELSAFDR
jgi:cytochrome c-type biogenesis protein CcmH